MPVVRKRLAAGLLSGLLLLAGCGDLEPAASAKGIARNDLVSQMVTQLSASASLTFTAAFHLAGGGNAGMTQAQRPARTAFDYPTGRLVITDKAVTSLASSRTVVSRAWRLRERPRMRSRTVWLSR